MQKLQDSVFSIIKTTNLSPAVFNFLQPTEECTDKTPLGGILNDTKHGWLALGPKFCVIDLRSGLKIAARIFGNGSSSRTSVTSVVELPTPLTPNSLQLVISLECDDVTGMICVFHVNGSQLLHCIQTEVVVTEVAVCDDLPSGPFMCFDGLVMAGTRRGEVFIFDLNRSCLVDALQNISQGHEDEIHNEGNVANIVFLPLKAMHKIESQRDLAVDNHDHLAVLLNESSLVDNQYIFRNPDGTVRMKAKRDHIRVTVVQYIPQLASVAVGFNFGAFQIWNILNLELEFTSQVNVECLPVTHFGFQEPCDDPRAFCYLWVVFSVIDRFEEEEFPLAVMYSLTYQGKRMLSENACLYQEFSMASIRFQVELSTVEDISRFVGGRCVSCHTYSINSSLGDDGDDSIYTNICQLVWECWGEHANRGAEHGMLLFDLDQWYKDQMPATYSLESNAFMSTTWCTELARGDCLTLDVRLEPTSVLPYSHATRLEEHFFPNSLQYNCISLNTSEVVVVQTAGVQRQTVSAMAAAGPSCLLAPARLRAACVAAGLTPLYSEPCPPDASPDEQRRYLLSVALEARLSGFLKRCAHDWATGTHTGAGCTLPFLVDWCWKRAIELKENAKELTTPLFTSSTLPDRNVIRCLEHCVQQLTQLTGLLDAVLTKCCNLVVPDALSEMEEKFKGIGTVSLYFQVVQWFLRVGLLPERHDAYTALPYPAQQLYTIYKKRRLKLQRLEDKLPSENENESCSLLYIDQLIEHEFGGERTHNMWIRGGSESGGLYPPPSLYSLLRLYLLPDIAEEHKHSLVLYLLVDYSMVYDDVQNEEVIRRLMQFPTMFGLSNTAIKATQAFWHLDHRDFDFALDQLQCLTGNTLSEWQHNVVLSALLAQKKTQAALQYLHVRKPAPIQNLRNKDSDYNRLSDHDKLEDWQSCCNLYLARGLVYEALDVIRMCVQNAGSVEDKMHVLNFFFKGCRNTGQLSKILNVTLMPFEEELFIKYLQNCNEPQTSDVLIMYYLQQARYLEAEQYNNKIKSKGRPKEFSTSVESLLDVMDREGARDTLVEVLCSALPSIANSVAHCARVEFEPHIIAPKPMSVFVQARSPKNTFTYKSSFIQDTIENASETWVNKPQMRRGIKRALDVEETPFICTPKLFKTKSLFPEQQGNESTPPKRAKLNLTGTPRTPKMQTPRVTEKLSKQMEKLLDMPEVQSPGYNTYITRSGAGTPHSILKNRRLEGQEREAPSPVDSRYLGESDDDLLETASNHTLYSDSKHLRFTIPTASEDGSTPSPVQPVAATAHLYKLERTSDDEPNIQQEEMPSAVSPPKKLAVEEVKSRKSYKDTVKARRSLSISANSSLSEDPNTSIESIADIPITLINPKYTGERSLRRERTPKLETENSRDASGKETEREAMDSSSEFSLPAPRTPKGRKGIRSNVETTPLFNRSRSVTPERVDSPVVTLMQVTRVTRSRSRSRTPELSPGLLAPIPELPKQESNAEPHPTATMLSIPRSLRSRSRTPERMEVTVSETSRLDPITESPTKTSDIEIPVRPSSRRSLRSKTPERLQKESETPKLEAIDESPPSSNVESPVSLPTMLHLRTPPKSPERTNKEREGAKLKQIVESPATPSNTDSPSSISSRRSLRSRSRTPEIEIVPEQPVVTSPRILRSRSKTPEKLMSPKKDTGRSKKSLSRMVLEANAFAKSKQNIEKLESESETKTTDEKDDREEEKTQSAIECTPMKYSKDAPKLLDVTFSPIVNKSILQSSSESVFSSTQNITKPSNEDVNMVLLPPFTTITESYTEKSILHSYESSVAETSSVCIGKEKIKIVNETQNIEIKSLHEFNTINETGFGKSVLKSFQSSVAESSVEESSINKMDEIPKTLAALKSLNETEFGKSVLRSEDNSVAITSDESFKDRKEFEETHKDISSLITDDSDLEMKDWERKMDSQETARVIQKEKEKIVEIQREINEIEGDMSDECQIDDDSDSNEDSDEGTDEEESEVESEVGGSESEDNESDSDEVISIEDSDDGSRDSESEEINIEPAPESKSNKQSEEVQIVNVENDKDKTEMTEITEETTDPLNQAQISMLTDDNSVKGSESIDLNYSDEVVAETVQKEVEEGNVAEVLDPTATSNKEDFLVAKDIDVVDAVVTAKEVEKIENIKTKAVEKPKIIEIDEDKSIKETTPGKEVERKTFEKATEDLKVDVKENSPETDLIDSSKIGFKDSKERKKVQGEYAETKAKESTSKLVLKARSPQMELEPSKMQEPKKTSQIEIPRKSLALDVEKEASQKQTQENTSEKEITAKSSEMEVDEQAPVKSVSKKISDKIANEKSAERDINKKAPKKDLRITVESEVSKENPEKIIKEKSSEIETKEIDAKSDLKTNKEENKPTTPSRKRTKSTSSTKLSLTTDEPKTPRTRKRTQSTSSNKSNVDDQNVEETKTDKDPKTVEEQKTPSGGRSNTPVKELRRVLTRRASRELESKLDEGHAKEQEEKMDDTNVPDVLTPRRRTRKIKAEDGNTSDSSVTSVKGSSDVKPSLGRKGRKKPELSVIPEVTAEESGMTKSTKDIKEYSGTERLTRHQKSTLQSWLEPSEPPQRPTSVASRSSLEGDDDTTTTTTTPNQSKNASPAFDISLNIPSYGGDEDEIGRTESTFSPLSESRTRNRLTRAASESKTTPRAARITRKASVDVVSRTSEPGSPAGGSSPARSRRASFTKACEALHTPKGRRTSIDVKKIEEESEESPAVTPARRSRRSSTSTSGRHQETTSPARTRKISEKKE